MLNGIHLIKMKTRLSILFLIIFLSLIPFGFSQCIKNEDWEKAPCLDVIGNGRYNQEDVNRWAEYYSYKGSEIMEAKYLELNNAVKEDRLDNWISESHENLNVYQYYFFSGRAPNTGEYHGYFNTIKVYEPDEFGNKRNFLNFQPIFSFGGIIIIEELIITGIIIAGIVSGFIIWRKRK